MVNTQLGSMQSDFRPPGWVYPNFQQPQSNQEPTDAEAPASSTSRVFGSWPSSFWLNMVEECWGNRGLGQLEWHLVTLTLVEIMEILTIGAGGPTWWHQNSETRILDSPVLVSRCIESMCVPFQWWNCNRLHSCGISQFAHLVSPNLDRFHRYIVVLP